MSVLIALCLVAWLFDKILKKVGRRLTAEYGFDLYGDTRSIIYNLEAFLGTAASLITLFIFDSDGFFFCLFAIWVIFTIIFTLHAKGKISMAGALLVSVLQAYAGYFGAVVGIMNFMAPGKKDFGGIITPGARVDSQAYGDMEFHESGNGYAGAGTWNNTGSSCSNEEFDSKKHWDMEQLSWEASRRGYTDVDAWASAGGYSSADDAYNHGYFDDKTY